MTSGTIPCPIDHVQGDPFASPSHVSVKVSLKKAGFPLEYHKEAHRRIALQDYLNRQFYSQIQRYTFRAKGSGKSGLISVSRCGQEILERSACQITGAGTDPSLFRGFSGKWKDDQCAGAGEDPF